MRNPCASYGTGSSRWRQSKLSVRPCGGLNRTAIPEMALRASGCQVGSRDADLAIARGKEMHNRLHKEELARSGHTYESP